VRVLASLIVVIVLSLAACSTSISHRVPTVAPAGVSPDRAERDIAECERLAAPGTDQRAERYAACMVARGHRAYVEVDMWKGRPLLSPDFGTRTQDVPFWIRRTGDPRDADGVFGDLAICAAVTRDRTRPSPVVGNVSIGLHSWWPGVGLILPAVERAYGECMGERGYAVEVWRP